MSPHVDALRNDLAAAAALGDERAAEVGARLAEAVARSAPLRFLEALGEALLEANEQLPSGHLELRLAGNDPNVVFVEEEGAVTATAVDEPSAARLTLRLPERLKSELEAAAAGEGVSVNTWLVRALSGAVSRQSQRSGRRLVGYGQHLEEEIMREHTFEIPSDPRLQVGLPAGEIDIEAKPGTRGVRTADAARRRRREP